MKRKTIQQSIKRGRGLPVVELKPSDYQPSKAELEADKSIDTTPEKLVKAFFSSGAPRREPRS